MQRWMVMGMMNEYIEKDFVLYTVQHFGSMLTWSKEDILAEIERVVKREKPIGDVVPVVRCKDCKKGRPIDETKCPEKYFKTNCVVCECEEVVGDEPMIYEPTHFCSYGENKNFERY